MSADGEPAPSWSAEVAVLRKDWLAISGDAFALIKAHFQLLDSWEFSIKDPDGVVPDCNPSEITDPRGAAAFMLRRIQALRHLIRQPEHVRPDLMLAYASDLSVYLAHLAEDPELDELTARTVTACRLQANLIVVATAPAALG